MNTVNSGRWIRRGIALCIVAAILLIGWQLLERPFVNVVVPAGADSVRLGLTAPDGTATTTKITKTSKIRLNSGTYTVAYFKGATAVGFSEAHIKVGFSQSIKGTVVSPTSKLSPVMHQHADLVSPLGKGYLYVDNVTRSISYVDAAGTRDMSQQFLLQQIDPQDSSFGGSYSTVIAMQPTRDGAVVVTTTAAVFLVKSPTDIQALPPSFDAFLNFTGSSYDPSTNRVFLLSTYHREIYYYDLGKIGSPKVLAKSPLDVNRINANGGKVIVYFDDIPSLEPGVIAAYGMNRQLAPIVIDATTGKTLKTFTGWEGTTQAAISQNGAYVVLKKKFATVMTVRELSGTASYTIPASDTNTILWQHDSLYFARDNGMWSVTPAQTKGTLTFVAESSSPIIRLMTSTDQIIATTNTNFIFTVVASSTDVSHTIGTTLRGLTLESSDYFIGFADFGSTAQVTIETKGDYTNGLDDASVAASKVKQYNEGLAALRTYATAPGITVSQKDTNISTPFESAGLPADDGGSTPL